MDIKVKAKTPIPEYANISNELTAKTKDDKDWYGHVHALHIGHIDENGKIESYFKKDIEMNTTDLLDRLKEDMPLIEKRRHIIDMHTFKEKMVTDFFIPYERLDWGENLPTITNEYVDRCSNVDYDVTMEILLAGDDDYKRYIYIDYETKGSFAIPFFEMVKDIEEYFNEFFKSKTQGFDKNEYGVNTVLFYNDIGQEYPIEIENMNELISMIASIRVVKCERTIKSGE